VDRAIDGLHQTRTDASVDRFIELGALALDLGTWRRMRLRRTTG
jgi:hypothetical protein